MTARTCCIYLSVFFSCFPSLLWNYQPAILGPGQLRQCSQLFLLLWKQSLCKAFSLKNKKPKKQTSSLWFNKNNEQVESCTFLIWVARLGMAVKILPHQNTWTKNISSKFLQCTWIFEKRGTNFQEPWLLNPSVQSPLSWLVNVLRSSTILHWALSLQRVAPWRPVEYLLNLPRTIRKAFLPAIPSTLPLTGRGHSEENINCRLFQWVPPAWGYSSARAPGPSGFCKHTSRESSSKTGEASKSDHSLWSREKTKLPFLVIIHVAVPTPLHKFLGGVSLAVKKRCIIAEWFLMLPSTNSLNSFNPHQTLSTPPIWIYSMEFIAMNLYGNLYLREMPPNFQISGHPWSNTAKVLGKYAYLPILFLSYQSKPNKKFYKHKTKHYIKILYTMYMIFLIQSFLKECLKYKMLVLQKDVTYTCSRNLPDSDMWQQSGRVTPT